MGRRRIDEHTLEVLEFDEVRRELATYASSDLGRAAAEKLRPSADLEWIAARMGETTELRRLLDEGVRVPLAGMCNIRPLIEGFGKKETVFEPEDLTRIGDTLATAGNLHRFLGDLDEATFPRLRAMASGLDSFEPLVAEINRCIDEEKRVCDEASEKLGDIRRAMERIHHQIRARFEAIVSSLAMRKAIENDNFMMRHGRPVVAIKANYRGHLHGTVLDRSNSGATLFVEPDALVELSNELEDVLFEEKKEVGRILFQLTRMVLDDGDRILANVRMLGFVDLAFARARFSVAYAMTAPEVQGACSFELRQARHPLLLRLASRRRGCEPAEAAGDVVPIDVRLGGDFDLLLVTGPNTGGKTVMLKTVGLLTLMAQSGMHLPVRADSKVCVFSRIFADIGDEQSIQQSLSTFSAHMRQLVTILKGANSHTLVLLDELGAGTDPTEGAALSEAFLDALLARQARAIATTHLGQLKNYAYRTSRAQNASVQFDRETLSPTYKLLIGTPGSSNALAIAARVGLEPAVVEHARSLLAADVDAASELINQVQATREAAERRRDEAQERLNEARGLKDAVERELARVRHESGRIKSRADNEIDKSMRQVRQAVQDYLAAMKNAPKPWREAAQIMAAKIEELAASTPLAQRQAAFIEALRKGDSVYVLSFGAEGVIDRIRRKHATIRVIIGDKQVEVGFDDVCDPRAMRP